jgi:hypothetical protein
MNLLHCLIFRCSRRGATRREGNPKSHRATIQSQKFKAVEWTPNWLAFNLKLMGSQAHHRSHRLTRPGLGNSSANR